MKKCERPCFSEIYKMDAQERNENISTFSMNKTLTQAINQQPNWNSGNNENLC